MRAGAAVLAGLWGLAVLAAVPAAAQSLTPGCFAGSRIHPCGKSLAFQPRKQAPRGPLTDALRHGPLDLVADPLGMEGERTGRKAPAVDEVRLPSQRARDAAAGAVAAE